MQKAAGLDFSDGEDDISVASARCGSDNILVEGKGNESH